MSYVQNNSNSDNAAANPGRKGPGPQLIALVVIAALAAIFFLQNGERTTVDFLVFESRTTIRWSIMMAVILGIVLDRLFSIWWRRRKKGADSENN